MKVSQLCKARFGVLLACTWLASLAPRLERSAAAAPAMHSPQAVSRTPQSVGRTGVRYTAVFETVAVADTHSRPAIAERALGHAEDAPATEAIDAAAQGRWESGSPFDPAETEPVAERSASTAVSPTTGTAGMERPADTPLPLDAVYRVLSVSVRDLRADETTRSAMLDRFHDALRTEAHRLSGAALSAQQVAGESLWLMRQPGVQVETCNRRAPLTGRVHTVMRLRIPLSVMDRWQQRLMSQTAFRNLILTRGAVVTAVGWLVSVGLVVLADRLTQGYRRSWLIPLGLGMPAAATILGWWQLLRTGYFAH